MDVDEDEDEGLVDVTTVVAANTLLPLPLPGCNLMTGQTEICITLGEVWVTSFSESPSPYQTAKLSQLRVRGQEFLVVIELSVSFGRDSTC